jgi:hypothetical protein
MSTPLRIVLCCQQDMRPHPVPAYRFWAETFRAALAEAGHACLEAPGCDWAEGLMPLAPAARAGWLEATWRRTVDFIRQEHTRRRVDLFLSYLYPDQVMAEALAELRVLGIPTVNFFCDNVRLFRQAPPQFRGFDLNWVPEANAVALYQRAGFRHLHAPMPCWVAPQWRSVPVRESLPPTFVGTRDELRARLFADAYGRGLEMDLRGVGWSGTPPSWGDPARGRGWRLVGNQWAYIAQHGVGAFVRKVARTLSPPAPVAYDFSARAKEPCYGDEYWRALRDSRVCVGVNRYPNPRRSDRRPDRYSRLRDIEAPMVGAAYLTEAAPGLDALYEIGREIEVYRDASELVEKVSALGRDAPRRQRLRENGQRRALADHGIARTLARITRLLGVG